MNKLFLISTFISIALTQSTWPGAWFVINSFTNNPWFCDVPQNLTVVNLSLDQESSTIVMQGQDFLNNANTTWSLWSTSSSNSSSCSSQTCLVGSLLELGGITYGQLNWTGVGQYAGIECNVMLTPNTSLWVGKWFTLLVANHQNSYGYCRFPMKNYSFYETSYGSDGGLDISGQDSSDNPFADNYAYNPNLPNISIYHRGGYLTGFITGNDILLNATLNWSQGGNLPYCWVIMTRPRSEENLFSYMNLYEAYN